MRDNFYVFHKILKIFNVLMIALTSNLQSVKIYNTYIKCTMALNLNILYIIYYSSYITLYNKHGNHKNHLYYSKMSLSYKVNNDRKTLIICLKQTRLSM